MELIFGSNNLAIESTTDYSIITGDEDAQFPLSNLKHEFTTKVFRSTGNSVDILVDTKTSTTKNMFCVVGSTTEGIAFNSLSIYGSNTTSFVGAEEIEIDFSDTYNFGFKRFTDCSYRYWKISISGNGSYSELAKIFLGEEYSFSTNTLSTANFEFVNNDNSSISKNEYGQKFTTTYNRIKQLSGSIDYIDRTEFDLLNYLYNTHGISVAMWMIYDEDDDSVIDGRYIFSGYYKFETTPAFKAVGGQLWNSQLTFTEVV